MTPIVATVDFDAVDARLLQADHPERSTWLLQNSVYVRLEAGACMKKASESRVVLVDSTPKGRSLRP